MSIKIIILFSFFNLIYLQHYKNSNPLKNLVCGEGIIENPSLIKYPKNINIENDFSPIRIFIDYTTFELECSKFKNIANFKSLIKEKLSKAANLMEQIIKTQRFKEKIYLNNDFTSIIFLSLPNYDQILTAGVYYDLIVSPKIHNSKSVKINFEKKYINFNSYPLVIEPLTKRPILGIIEIFDLDYSTMDNLETYFLNSFIHQLMHIMVFDTNLIKNFPNYSKDSPPYIKEKDYSQYKMNNFIVTPKVISLAKRHFNNPQMLGLELDSNTLISEDNMYHWNARFMIGDIMIADFYEEQAISEITLGLFEDSNWYKVNYYTGGLFRTGKNETFIFTDLKCINPYDYFIDNMFCTEENEKRCTGGRLNKGLCKFYKNEGIPSYFQYFSDNSTKGGRGNVDFCPITQKEDESRSQIFNFYPGSCQNGLLYRNIDIKDLKVILRALGFEPQEDEVKRLLSTINRSDDEENNKKGFSTNTIDFEEFKKIMSNKLRESEEIEQLKVGFHSFTDKTLPKEPGDSDYITLRSLREVAHELNEVINDEELKEMMVQANPELKNLINEGKGDDESIFKISQTQFNQLLDRIKSGN